MAAFDLDREELLKNFDGCECELYPNDTARVCQINTMYSVTVGNNRLRAPQLLRSI